MVMSTTLRAPKTNLQIQILGTATKIVAIHVPIVVGAVFVDATLGGRVGCRLLAVFRRLHPLGQSIRDALLHLHVVAHYLGLAERQLLFGLLDRLEESRLRSAHHTVAGKLWLLLGHATVSF